MSYWNNLPKISIGWFPYIWLLAIAAMLPGTLYGQRLSQKAIEEGRVQPLFGMVSKMAASRELKRAAQAGDKVALIILRTRVLVIVALIIAVFWPKYSA
ncbi:MAG: hypothetical protein H0T56_12155 [Pseudaminobacter sp.]|nr:hypothetical protein [Pseudaminobacter sp.]